MKNSLHKQVCRALLVLACVLTTNFAWAQDTYCLVGNNTDIFGASWGNGSTSTEMSPMDNNIYIWNSPEFVVVNNYNVEYKVYRNHDYNQGQWPNNGNANYYISTSGRYTMSFTFNLGSNTVTATLNDIFTVAGSETLFGSDWNLLDTNNDMTNNNGVWTWMKSAVRLPAGIVYFKVVKGRDFGYGSWPANDYELNIPSDGVYDVSITFSDGQVNATLTQIPAIAHDNTNFPDQNFLNSLSTAFPTETADGYWTPDELATVTSIDCKNANISTLKGIENFTALTSLDCSGNKLTSIDLTINTALTSATLNGQSVAFNNIVRSITYNNHTYYFIWLNNQYNGQDPWFVGTIQQLDGMGSQSQFNLSRVTWGEGCQEFTGTAQNNTSNSIGLQALSDGLPADMIAGKVLLVDGDVNGGTFKYNYAASSTSKDGSSMEVAVNWIGASVPTGIDTVGAGEIKTTRYYNLMGVESATPFQGVNIIVKEYSDGTRDTSKVIMK